MKRKILITLLICLLFIILYFYAKAMNYTKVDGIVSSTKNNIVTVNIGSNTYEFYDNDNYYFKGDKVVLTLYNPTEWVDLSTTEVVGFEKIEKNQ